MSRITPTTLPKPARSAPMKATTERPRRTILSVSLTFLVKVALSAVLWGGS